MTATAASDATPAVTSDEGHDDMGGLHRDRQAFGRRRALQIFGAAGTAGLLAACGGESVAKLVSSEPVVGTAASAPATVGTTATTALAADVAASAGTPIPSETAGPFPADGTNGPNVLADGAIVRRDITTSFGDFTGTASGRKVALTLTIVDAATGGALPGAAVYLWHCTADGKYSIYEVSDENYLRGLQVADDAGRVTFDTIFPGCYGGRWPHCHFEVFDTLNDANDGRAARRTSQLALPEADCQTVYADGAYGNSLSNLDRLSLAGDMVFRDGWTEQLATFNPSANTINLLVRV